MLEHLPNGLGRALRNVRSGLDELVWACPAAETAPDILTVESSAFGDGEPLPIRYTQDGERLSPPLAWHGAPVEAACVLLIVEDADSLTPQPLVHAIAWNLPIADTIEAGELSQPPSERDHLGWNSFHQADWLAPDPPPGHGPHRYVFQVFALDRPLSLDRTPGRKEILAALKGRVCAKGRLIGTYERG
jgi:Raf kinase inhibitor-like YbhB/YbcL family protein